MIDGGYITWWTGSVASVPFAPAGSGFSGEKGRHHEHGDDYCNCLHLDERVESVAKITEESHK